VGQALVAVGESNRPPPVESRPEFLCRTTDQKVVRE
jgi:hypothetical protein